jgi:hypothetical protein
MPTPEANLIAEYKIALGEVDPNNAGPTLLIDGDCEAAGTADWTATHGTLSKELVTPYAGLQCLRVTADASSAGDRKPNAGQAVLTVGVPVLVEGRAPPQGV